MQQDNTKCVIIVDFTKWGLVVDGNVHCFVVCILYNDNPENRGALDLNDAMLFLTR